MTERRNNGMTVNQLVRYPVNRCSLSRAGFGLIEAIVAVSIFAIIAATATIIILHGFSINRLGDEETEATFFAQEGIEAIRSIKNQGWNDPFLATDCRAGCGLDSGGGSWSFSGSSDTRGKFTRASTVSDVYRSEGSIVESGGTLDPETQKVTSTVTWSFSPTRSNTVEVITYLTHWDKVIE